MLSGGDELGRTQQGNNNAYCQDNALSWFDWQLEEGDRRLLDYTRQLIALRLDHPTLHRPKFFQGRKIRGSEVEDLAWFQTDGLPMTDEEWELGWVQVLGMRIGGDALEAVDEAGNPLTDDDFFILLNAHEGEIDFTIPAVNGEERWEVVLDTTTWDLPVAGRSVLAGEAVKLAARSMVLLRRAD
jgi:glycogen operon protein